MKRRQLRLIGHLAERLSNETSDQPMFPIGHQFPTLARRVGLLNLQKSLLALTLLTCLQLFLSAKVWKVWVPRGSVGHEKGAGLDQGPLQQPRSADNGERRLRRQRLRRRITRRPTTNTICHQLHQQRTQRYDFNYTQA